MPTGLLSANLTGVENAKDLQNEIDLVLERAYFALAYRYSLIVRYFASIRGSYSLKPFSANSANFMGSIIQIPDSINSLDLCMWPRHYLFLFHNFISRTRYKELKEEL